MDNLLQLDQGGTNCQFTRTWMGPTLGWMMLPVMPELEVTTTTPIQIGPYTSRLILKAAVKQIQLPSVSQWVQAYPPLANISAFDRSIWIKDWIAAAGAGAPIIVTPFGTDLIDNYNQFQIITPNALIRLYPMTDLTGWYVG